MDPHAIASLENALRISPADLGLRVRLVKLLLESNHADEAMQHAYALLYFEPDNLVGLELSATAADAIGKPKRADAYRRIIRALQDANAAPDAGIDEIDDFLNLLSGE